MYYNNGNINQNDGLVVYISEYIIETMEIIDINNLKIINTKIAIENNKEIILSALYRSHDIKKTEFTWRLGESTSVASARPIRWCAPS